MFSFIVKKFIGSKNERELKKMWPIVEKINALEASISSLSDEQLKHKTEEFKEEITVEFRLNSRRFARNKCDFWRNSAKMRKNQVRPPVF